MHREKPRGGWTSEAFVTPYFFSLSAIIINKIRISAFSVMLKNILPPFRFSRNNSCAGEGRQELTL